MQFGANTDEAERCWQIVRRVAPGASLAFATAVMTVRRPSLTTSAPLRAGNQGDRGRRELRRPSP